MEVNNKIKSIITPLNNLFTLVVFILVTFASEVFDNFGIQASNVESLYLFIYPFFSTIFLMEWLRYRKNKSRIKKLIDDSELLSTAINIMVPILAVIFIYMLPSEEGSTANVADFAINFISIGLLIPAAISQTAHVVKSLSMKRIYLYFAVIAIFAFAITIEEVRNISFFVQEFRFILFILLFTIVNFPHSQNAPGPSSY